MKILKNKAFTLVEILISAVILSVTVFWVYKLIWENTKIINNSDNYLQANILLQNAVECIEHIWFLNFKNTGLNNHEFNFWSTQTWCLTWSQLVSIDNIDYKLLWEITNSWTYFIDWKISVFSDSIWNTTKTYKQIKK